MSKRAGLDAIKETIPHRPPFLLLDEIVDHTPGEFAIATRRIDPGDPTFAGHFPDFAVFPGVLLIENMAQTACFAIASAAEPGTDAPVYLLARVNQCTFSRMVRPGDTLTTEARLARDFGRLAQFDCVVKVGNETAAKAELLVGRGERS